MPIIVIIINRYIKEYHDSKHLVLIPRNEKDKDVLSFKKNCDKIKHLIKKNVIIQMTMIINTSKF